MGTTPRVDGQVHSGPRVDGLKSPRVGANVPRKDGVGKVTGEARYIDDIVMDGMLHGATIRSPLPHGRLKGVHFEGDLPWDEFIVVTADDVPGSNTVTMIESDQPFLAGPLIKHADEAVVLIAHADKHLVEKARRHVRLEIEALEPILSIADSVAADVAIYGDDNIFKTLRMSKGDAAAALLRDDVIIVEGTYTTGAQEQMYIETQGMIAQAVPGEKVTVHGSLQCPYYVHKALGPLFDLPGDKIRVVQSVTGGGFGGKEDYPSIIAGHAALLSWKAGGVPVKLIYDRVEDLACTTKRHPSRTIHRTAVTKDGKLVAMDVDFICDSGAYATLSSVVLSRGTIHACGPYSCDNINVYSRAMATNYPPHGAFRGFGAPQSCFALERHMDQIAKAVGLAPEELRRRNLLVKGQTTATSQTVDEDIDLPAMMDFALDKAEWTRKKAEFAEHNANPANTVKKGLGLSTFLHGSGFTGSGEVYLASVAGVQLEAGGRVEVLAASTEIGQGTNTIFSQIASDALSVPYEWISIGVPDTDNVPDSGPTVASRTTMVVGKLVERASRQVRKALIEDGALDAQDFSAQGFAAAADAYLERHGSLKKTAKYTPPLGIVWDDANYRGSAYACYGWACYVAEVSVDTVTYQARVTDFVAVQDIGKVMHPVLAAGQVEGGVVQAIGYAIYEGCTWKEGHMANNQMTNYIIPTSADVPDVHVYFQEVPFSYGPSGAKGVGELPMDGPAPAIVNAIEDAIGVSINVLPALPEVIMEAVLSAEAAKGNGHV